MSSGEVRLEPGVDRLDEVDMQQHRRNAAMGTMDVVARGGDPLVDTPRFGGPIPGPLDIERRFIFERQRNQRMNEEVFLNPASGYGEIKGFIEGVAKQYREQNESQLIKKPKNEEEALLQMQQLRPVKTDPNLTANARQMAVKVDQLMKSIDPRTSFWTDPRTKKIGEWLNREAGGGGVGYLQSGEQEMKLGVAGRAASVGLDVLEGVADMPMNLAAGMWDVARQSVATMGGPDIGPIAPTNYIEDDHGNLVANGGKVPSFVDGLTTMWAMATGRNVEQSVAQVGRARELEIANRNGFEKVMHGAARLGGSLVGMAPMGAAQAIGAKLAGNLTQRGLQALGALRLGKGLQESERAVKIIRAMGAGIGAGVANGATEALAYGRGDGYAKSFLHGIAMTPVLLALGAMGRKTEWFAGKRLNMPAGAAKLVGSGMEGLGFGFTETTFPNLLPATWGFIKDPSEETWQTYAKNMAGFMLFNVASRGRRPPPTSVDPTAFHVERSGARAKFAEGVARGEVSAEEISRAPTADEQKLRTLGEASIASREGRTAEERAAATEAFKKAESDLDVAEFGVKGTAETELKAVVDDLPGERPSLREELAAVREMPAGRERNQKVIDLLKRGREELASNTMKASFGETKRLLDLKSEQLQARRVVRNLLELPSEPRTMAEKAPDKPKKKLTSFEDPRTEEMAKQIEVDPAELVGMAKASGSTTEQMFKEMGGDVSKLTKAAETAVSPETAEAYETMAAARTSDAVEQRISDPTGPAGERAGPQSFQVPPTTQVAGTPGVQPVRASDIIKAMQGRPGAGGLRIPFTSKRIASDPGDPVQVSMKGGKIRGPEMGHFKFFENLIRTREGRDLVTSAHEWSHAMHRHMSGRGGAGFVSEAKKQVRLLNPDQLAEMDVVLKDYPGSQTMPAHLKWMETWAEWHARNLLGETGLAQKLPHLTQHFQSWLAKPEQAALREQYQSIQEMLYRYNAQGSEERVRQSIVLDTDPMTLEEKSHQPSIMVRARDAITKQLFDDVVELKKSQDRWLAAAGRKPEDVKFGEDPARMYDALRMTAGKTAEHFVMRGIRQPDGTMIPGMRELLEPIQQKGQGAWEDFYKYAVSLRNMALFKRGREIQLPPQDYVETVKAIEARHPEFREAAAGLKRWTDALVDYVARSGNVDPQQAQKIKDAYAFYVPFFRVSEGPAKHGQGRGSAERGTGMSTIEGSTLEVRDPLVALQEVAQSMIAKAHQNQVITSLYKLAHGHEAGGLATVIPRSLVPHDHPMAQMLDAIQKGIKLPANLHGKMETLFDAIRDADVLDSQTITTFTHKVIPTGERSVIAYTPRLKPEEIAELVAGGANRHVLERQNNKLQWLEVDPKAYEQLMGIDKMPQLPESMHGIMRILQAPRDLVRFFATGISPAFTAANMIRDAITAPMFAPDGRFRPFGGFIDAIRGGIEYHKNGRMRELYEELGVKTSSFYNEGTRREITGQSAGFRAKFLEVTGRIQEFFAHPENYLRMTRFKEAYEKSIAEGRPEQEARLHALEAGKEVMNFARAGILSRMLNQMIPYFNAGLQGKRKFYGQMLWGGDAKGDEAKARVQRATILNGMAAITMPSLALWLINKDEEWYQDLPDWRKINYWNVKMFDEIVSIPKPFEAGTIFGSIPEIILDRQLDNAHPASLKSAAEVALGAYMEGIGAFIPAFIRPLIETSANYDFFRRRELTPEWIGRAMPRAEQSTFYTTATARILSQAVNGVLTPIQIEHMLGGYTAGATTSAMRAMDEIAGLKDHPLGLPLPWTRFLAQVEHGQSAHVDDLYKISVDLDQRDDELTSKERGLKHRIDAAKRRISDIRKQNRTGKISREEAERRAYEIAKPLVDRSNQGK